MPPDCSVREAETRVSTETTLRFWPKPKKSLLLWGEVADQCAQVLVVNIGPDKF